jgi:hypothetical protein
VGGASVVLGGSHQILDGHVFGLGMTNYTIKKSYTIRFATMHSEKTLQSKKKPNIYPLSVNTCPIVDEILVPF